MSKDRQVGDLQPSAARPVLPLESIAANGSNLTVTGRSSENWSLRLLRRMRYSRTRPNPDRHRFKIPRAGNGVEQSHGVIPELRQVGLCRH